MSNYPPGSDTPDAPWNQKDSEDFKPDHVDQCEECEEENVMINSELLCESCFNDKQEAVVQHTNDDHERF